MRLVLLHSALVGPATWSLLAPVLEARGHRVIVPDFRPVMHGKGPYYPALVRAVAEGVEPAPDAPILVAHSAAGALVSAIVSASGAPACAVFVDALLPHPRKSWFDTVPEELVTRLRAMSQDGRVPPWHRWWPKGAIEALLGIHYEAFAAELGDLPLDYFSEGAPECAELPADRCAYLQLSAAYGGAANDAGARGWLTRRMQSNHFAMLTNPSDFAGHLETIAKDLAKKR